MKWIVTTIITFLGLLVIPFISNDKPKIVYTVSDNIPISSDEDNYNNIQQIEVKNTGNSVGKNIKVKIDKEIDSFRIIKDSEQDTVEEYTDIFEIVYSELPPDGSFKLIIESNLTELNKDLLTIKSDRGVARNGLEDEGSPYARYFFLSFIVIYLIFILYSLKDFLRHNKLEKLITEPTDNIGVIYKKKPFYFTEQDWKKILKRFIELKLNEDLIESMFSTLEESSSYYILKNEQVSLFEDDEWSRIKSKAKKVFFKRVDNEATEEYMIEQTRESYIEIYELMVSLPESLRNEINKKLSNNYMALSKIHTVRSMRVSTINKNLKEKKPSFVISEDWDKFKIFLSEIQYMGILIELYKPFHNPLKIIEEYKSVLIENNKELELLAYNIMYYQFIKKYLNTPETFDMTVKPKWMEDKDFEEIKKVFSELKMIEDSQRKVLKQQELIGDILVKQNIPESKPEYIEELAWTYLKEYIRKQKSFTELEKKQSEIAKKELANKQLMEKLEKQLYIINEVFQDPGIIDRIESYEDIFAEGNHRNLIKLSRCLKQKDIYNK